MPIDWTQLKTTLTPERFTVEHVARRSRVDPWKAYWTCRQKIAATSFDAIRRMAA